jgi:hypothetical protein
LGETVALPGTTAIDVSVAEPTVKVAVADFAPNVAVIVEVPPAAAAEGTAIWPRAVPKAATVDFDVAQMTLEVKSNVVPSEKTPIAWSCSDTPACVVGLAGLMTIELSVAELTDTFALPDPAVAEVAMIVAILPAVAAVATVTRPGTVVLKLATPVAEDNQVMLVLPVKSCVLPSE